MPARKDKFDPNRPRSTPPRRGRTEEEVKEEERDPSSTESEAADENGGDELSRTAEIGREADEEFEERRRKGDPEGGA